MAHHVVPLEVRRRHAQRVGSGLLPAALGIPSMSPSQFEQFRDDMNARGLSAELDRVVKEELADDAAGARDLKKEAPLLADTCRRRARAWRAAGRMLRPKAPRSLPRTQAHSRTVGRAPRARRSASRRVGEASPAGGDPPGPSRGDPAPEVRVAPWRATATEADAWLDALARVLIAASKGDPG